MPEDVPCLADLLTRARQGRDDATTTLHRLFTPYLLAVADCCLSRRLRAKEDAEDVVQNVWREFFANVPPPERFPDAAHLRAWLATLTRRRASDVNRRYLKRPTHNLQRECSLDNPSVQQEQGILVQGACAHWEEDLDDLEELRRHAGQLSDVEGDFAYLLLSGFPLDCIALLFAVSPKRVRRVLRGLARRGGIYKTAARACG